VSKVVGKVAKFTIKVGENASAFGTALSHISSPTFGLPHLHTRQLFLMVVVP
jgi:hypothetical protein